MVPLNHYLVLSATLFAIGTAGVFLRRNLITIMLSIEIIFKISSNKEPWRMTQWTRAVSRASEKQWNARRRAAYNPITSNHSS